MTRHALHRTARLAITTLIAFLLAPPFGARAAPLQPLKVAYLGAIDTVVLHHAVEAGFFKQQGLDVQTLRINDGPAVISAVLSGSAQIGYAAATPPAIAYEHGQPLSIFATANYERYPYSANMTTIIASKRSGITTIAGLKGKTIASNAQPSGCTITIEQHLAQAGLSLHDVKLLIIPFPNMQAAMALGETDAVCTIVPFLTAMQLNPGIKPTVLARGTIADLKKIGKVAVTSYFSSSSWVKSHHAVIKRFLVAMQKSQADLNAHPAVYHRDLIKYFHMKPAFAAKVPLAISNASLVAKPSDYQSLFDALHKAGMLPKPLKAAEVVTTITP